LRFSDFAFSPVVLRAIENAGYTAPMPIQTAAIPAILEGEDVVACAQTGTGKTAAFLLPIIEGLLNGGRAPRYRPQALILEPTRELAQQVADHFAVLARQSGLRCVVTTGGVDIGPQEVALGNGVHVLVATPGRLLEHLSRGALRFSELRYLVVDEADRLLDEGFLPDVQRIADALPERRQTLLFSATLSPEVDKLARTLLHRPRRIQIGEIAPRESIVEKFYPVAEHQKLALFRLLVQQMEDLEQLIVFVRTRARAAELAPIVRDLTGLDTAELHADLSQGDRNRALEAFRAGTVRVLVATDVAARGLDIPEVTHIVNFDVPNSPEDYIHRIGRTGRAHRGGVAITLASLREESLAERIRQSVRRGIPHERLAGFPYEEPRDEGPTLLGNRKSARRPGLGEPGTAGDRREKPFTRDGQLKREFREKNDQPENMRNRRKRIERKSKRRLPHQRRNG
jgi:ATP-dependent RNA helicase RhlE